MSESVATARTGARRVTDVVADVVRTTFHEFLWKALRAGAVRLRGLSGGMQATIVVSTLLLLATTVSFAAPGILRESSHLLVVPDGAGRGTLVPSALVPITFALLTIGAALALGGALHATLPARLGILFVYLTVALGFHGLATSLESASGTSTWPGWLFIAGVPVMFAVRWRAKPRPATELVVLLVLVAGTFAVSGHSLVAADRFTGQAFALQQLSLLLGQLALVSFPLLFVAGLDVIGFGIEATTSVVRFIDRRVNGTVIRIMLAVVLVWRGKDVVGRLLDDALLPIVGSALLVALIGAWWWWLGRFGPRPGTEPGDDSVDHGSGRVRLPLGLAFAGISLVLAPTLLLAQSLAFFDVLPQLIRLLGNVADALSNETVVFAYRLTIGITMCVLGVRAARSENRTLAMFLGAVGISEIVSQLLDHAGPLDALLWADAKPIDSVWTLVIVGVSIRWALRRELSASRAARMLFIAALGALLSRPEAIADPLSPWIGFAGVGVIVFGLVWGFLTQGGWTNLDTPKFPRSSRVFLYLGYSLFSVALLSWFAVTHDIAELATIQGTGENGLVLLGRPLLYALSALLLAGAITDRPIAIDA